MSNDLWMLLAQKALAMHELGHILWSNWTYSKKIYDELRENHGQFVADVFQQIRNIIEDARVDRGIDLLFPGAGFYIKKLRENDSKLLFESIQNKDETELTNPLFQYSLFLYDQLIYDSGVFKWLVSQHYLHPVTERLILETSELVQQALLEPDGRKVQKVYRDITLKVVEILREEGLLTKVEFIPLGISFEDHNKSHGTDQRKLSISQNRVPNLTKSFNQLVGEVDKNLSNLSTDEEDSQESESECEESNALTRESSNTSLGDSKGEKEGSQSTDVKCNFEDKEQEILENLQRELNQELGNTIDTEEFRKVVESDYDGRVYPIGPNYKAYSRFNEERIRSIGNIIARNLLTVLRERTKGGWKTGYKSGRLHTKSLWKLSRNDYRIFKRKEKEKKLNYQCFILLDRSGSMYGDKIYKAEYATLILCYALEKVGIQTEVVGFNSISIDLHKTLEESFEYAKYKITQLWAVEGTPTHKALWLVKRRISQLATKNPFIIIITDGYPDDPKATIEEIKTCPYPVVGVTIDVSGTTDWEKVYHAEVGVKTVDELLPALTQLVRKLMF